MKRRNKNQILYALKEEVKAANVSAVQDKGTFLAEIQGSEIQTEEAFVFPYELPKMILGWYNDYIHNLLWIEQDSIVLIMYDYPLMLLDKPHLKEEIIETFAEITLPWWDKDVVGHMVGGKPRSFMIYLEM